jgi:serine/threonine-protein kinase
MNTLVLLADRYEVRGRLGLGGMAEVRDGWDTRLNRPVAIKLLHPALTARDDLRSRFDAEARAAAALNHPNIVAVHDTGEHHGTPFIVMERLPGETLADRIACGPLPPAQVHAILDNILAALVAAHRAGILHRDIKPHNILVGPDGDVMKVADFGIAKTQEIAHTRTGEVVGTIAYLSPQRLLGSPACAGDDVYAAGVVGYEALAGQRPFPHDNMAALARAILHDRPPPLGRLRPDVHPGLIAVIERAIAPDPRQRYASAEDMRADLRGALHAPPAVAPMPARRPATKVLDVPLPPPIANAPVTNTYVPPMVARPASRRHKVLAALAVLSLLIVVPLAFALDPATSNPPAEPVPAGTTSAPSPEPAGSSTPPLTTPPSTAEAPQAPAPHGPGGPPGKGHGKGHGG